MCSLCRGNSTSEATSAVIINANVVPSSLVLSILMMEAVGSSKTLGLARATRHHIQQDGNILCSALCVYAFNLPFTKP
jgi:hypothetical protein